MVFTIKLTYLSIFILVLWILGFCVMALLCTRECRFCDSRYFWGQIFKFKLFPADDFCRYKYMYMVEILFDVQVIEGRGST